MMSPKASLFVLGRFAAYALISRRNHASMNLVVRGASPHYARPKGSFSVSHFCGKADFTSCVLAPKLPSSLGRKTLLLSCSLRIPKEKKRLSTNDRVNSSPHKMSG